MLASYILSRTLVPTLAAYLPKAKAKKTGLSRNLVYFASIRHSEGIRAGAAGIPGAAPRAGELPQNLHPGVSADLLVAFLLVPWLGQDFSQHGYGQFILHVRAKTGTRIEEVGAVRRRENTIREMVPAQEMDSIIDNYRPALQQYQLYPRDVRIYGHNDADIMVSLKPKHRPTADYVRNLRIQLAHDFSGVVFIFCPPI